MGANVVGAASIPQYRENTLRSLEAAQHWGADFVEFDVQVTQDGEPVLWHDDRLVLQSATGLDSRPICDMTAAAFKGSHATSASCTVGMADKQPTKLVRTVYSSTSGACGGDASLWDVAKDDSLPTLHEVLEVSSLCTFEPAIPAMQQARPHRCFHSPWQIMIWQMRTASAAKDLYARSAQSCQRTLKVTSALAGPERRLWGKY